MKTVLAYFNILFQNLPAGTKNLNQDSRIPSLRLKPITHEYKARLLAIKPGHRFLARSSNIINEGSRRHSTYMHTFA